MANLTKSDSPLNDVPSAPAAGVRRTMPLRGQSQINSNLAAVSQLLEGREGPEMVSLVNVLIGAMSCYLDEETMAACIRTADSYLPREARI